MRLGNYSDAVNNFCFLTLNPSLRIMILNHQNLSSRGDTMVTDSRVNGLDGEWINNTDVNALGLE